MANQTRHPSRRGLVQKTRQGHEELSMPIKIILAGAGLAAVINMGHFVVAGTSGYPTVARAGLAAVGFVALGSVSYAVVKLF